MEFPFEMREKINELVESADIKQLERAAGRLSLDYRNESGEGKRSASSDIDVLAYCAARMPATFAAVSRALELSLECFRGEIGSVLDAGAGTGAGAAAAAALTGCKEIRCVEREENMISVGRGLLMSTGVEAEWIKLDIREGAVGKADLAICSYCLNELAEKDRAAALDELIDTAEKMLVIVEPGTPKAFEEIIAVRGELIRRGLTIAAPCPGTSECGLPNGDWCHFTARAARTKIHKRLKNADVPYEDEKFCFIAAVKNPALAAPCEARVLRHPVIGTGRAGLKLCTENGIEDRLVTKKDSAFKTARKSRAGDNYGQ